MFIPAPGREVCQWAVLAVALVAGAFTCFVSEPARAANRALLVGVSGYKQKPLWEPAHDVALIDRVLRAALAPQSNPIQPSRIILPAWSLILNLPPVTPGHP